MCQVGIIFSKQLLVCFREVSYRNCLNFGDVQFRGENLRGAVDKKGLPGGLCVNSLHDFRREGLSDFLGILSEELTYLLKCEIGQVKFILDVKG